MHGKFYNNDDLKEIAIEIIDMLRPKHLRVKEIKEILSIAIAMTENIVLREKIE